jgi:steroid delta-isomerase-like uncharacterized protein
VKSIARRWFEEVWNGRRDAAVDELMAAGAHGHMEGGDVRGPDGFRPTRDMFLSAIPDLHIEVEEVLAEGERAAVRWRARGHHKGEGFGFEATGKPIDIRGTSWFVIRKGQLVEGWDTWNLNGMMESLKESP